MKLKEWLKLDLHYKIDLEIITMILNSFNKFNQYSCKVKFQNTLKLH